METTNQNEKKCNDDNEPKGNGRCTVPGCGCAFFLADPEDNNRCIGDTPHNRRCNHVKSQHERP